MKIYSICLLLLVFSACKQEAHSPVNMKESIHQLINQWHEAAGKADFKTYFDCMSPSAIFIGTDATEKWTRPEFEKFCKPYFDKGKAWNFKSLQREIYFNDDSTIAWFDELLSTQMKICRGSGVLVNTPSGWKIQHYVLSMTIPNEFTKEVTQLKTSIEDSVMSNLNTSTTEVH